MEEPRHRSSSSAPRGSSRPRGGSSARSAVLCAHHGWSMIR